MFAGYALLQLPEFILMIYQKLKRTIQNAAHSSHEDRPSHNSPNVMLINPDTVSENISTMPANRETGSSDNLGSQIDVIELSQQVSCHAESILQILWVKIAQMLHNHIFATIYISESFML